MLYESTKTLLRSIVQSLEHIEQVGWEDQVESGQECLYEMHQMARTLRGADGLTIADRKCATPIENLGTLSRAIPHVRAMVTAIRHRDQAGALHGARAALSEMNARNPVPSPRRAVEPQTGRSGRL
jgi:hypothetical protein